MSDLNEISRTLGSIEATQVATNKTLDKLADHMEQMRQENSELSARFTYIETELKDEVQPTLEELQDLKNKGVGILAAMGVVCSFIGYTANKAIKYFFNV